MKDYSVYLWMAYLTTLSVLLLNLIIPVTRYYKLLRKKIKKNSPPKIYSQQLDFWQGAAQAKQPECILIHEDCELSEQRSQKFKCEE